MVTINKATWALYLYIHYIEEKSKELFCEKKG